MQDLINTLAALGLIILLVLIAIYVVYSIFLNRLHKLKYGKKTAAAWIPIANCYIAGKLAFGKPVGWIYLICIFLTGSYTTEVNGEEVASGTILPKDINNVLSVVLFIASIVFFVVNIIQYNKLKKAANNQVNSTLPNDDQSTTPQTNNYGNSNTNDLLSQHFAAEKQSVHVNTETVVEPQVVQQPVVSEPIAPVQPVVEPQVMQQPTVMDSNQPAVQIVDTINNIQN